METTPNFSKNPINTTSTPLSDIEHPHKNAYVTLRRIALFTTILFIVAVLVVLLYMNGKSLYDNGL